MTNKPIPRELTNKERKKIRKLVLENCTNYDKEYGCLPLDCDCCYMLGKWYTGSFCKYFRSSILPLNLALESAITDQYLPTKPCKICGKRFPVKGRQAYCSEKCRETGTRKATAERTRKYRNNMG